MCKGSLCKEKCKTCYEMEMSCCNTIPTFNSDELAKLHYNDKILDRGDLGIYQVGRNEFVVAKPEWVTSKGIRIDEHTCPFLDKDGSCKIYDYRPNICRIYGDDIDCGMKNLSIEEIKDLEPDVINYILFNVRKHKMKDIIKNVTLSYGGSVINAGKYNKKLLKHMKDDMFFYLFGNMIQSLKDEYLKENNISIVEKYHLVKVNGRLSSMKLDRYKVPVEYKFKPIFDLYNKAITKLYIKPPEYQEIIVGKLNSIINGLKSPDIKENDDYNSNDLTLVLATNIIYKYC